MIGPGRMIGPGVGMIGPGRMTGPGVGIGPGPVIRCTSTMTWSGALRSPEASITSSRKRCRPTGRPASTVMVGSRVICGVPTTKRAMRSSADLIRSEIRPHVLHDPAADILRRAPVEIEAASEASDPGPAQHGGGCVLVGDDHDDLVRLRPEPGVVNDD